MAVTGGASFKSSRKEKATVQKRNAVPASTYVSSPVGKRPPKLPPSEEDEDESDAFEPPPKRLLARKRSHDEDHFKASFEPMPRRRSPTRGSPITGDERIASLSTIHRTVIDGFVADSKNFLQKLVISRKLRAPPFTDGMLREMAIDFPQDKDSFCAIPGIDEDKYELYGKQFLERIRRAKSAYDEMMRSEEVSRMADPNRRNVVDLVSDEELQEAEERQQQPFRGEEDLDDEFDDDDDFDSISQETSQYFGKKTATTDGSRNGLGKIQHQSTAAPKKKRAPKRPRQSTGGQVKTTGAAKNTKRNAKGKSTGSWKSGSTGRKVKRTQPVAQMLGGIQAMPI